jgi:integrase
VKGTEAKEEPLTGELVQCATPDRELTDYSRLVEQAQAYAAESHSKNTLRAYNCAWRSFGAWCASHGTTPLRPDREALVGLYIGSIADQLKPASISAAIAGLRHHYHTQSLSLDTGHPAITATLKGIRRAKGTRQVRKTPLLVPDLQSMVAALPETPMGARDRALLLLGFAGAFRRSELVSLQVEDLELTSEGYRVLLRKSKTDQEGMGVEKAIPCGTNPSTCPVTAVKGWLEASGIEEGPLFRSINRHGRLGASLSDRSVAEVIKRNPALEGRSADFSGHSLRAGLCTAAASARCPEHIIMAQSGHKSRDMVQRYVRTGLQFKDNAAGVVGL